MQDIIIYTHKAGRAYMGPHFFILSKGKNSGRPSYTPNVNSFVVQFEDWSRFHEIFWFAYSLWKRHFWRTYQVGSVILFLRLFEFKKEFRKQVDRLQTVTKPYGAQLKTLVSLEKKEQACRKQLDAISDARSIVLSDYHNKIR